MSAKPPCPSKNTTLGDTSLRRGNSQSNWLWVGLGLAALFLLGVLLIGLIAGSYLLLHPDEEMHASLTVPAESGAQPIVLSANVETGIVQYEVSGEAFAKLVRGTELLSGLPIMIHPANKKDQLQSEFTLRKAKIAANRQEARTIEADIQALSRQIGEHERLLRAMREASDTLEDWISRREKAQFLLDDFSKMGYDRWDIINPLTNQQTRIAHDPDRESWQQYIASTRKMLESIRDQCVSNRNTAQEKVDQLSIGLSEYDRPRLEQDRRDAEYQLIELRTDDYTYAELIGDSIASDGIGTQVLTDSTGSFSISLPEGQYTFLSTYDDELSDATLAWAILVRVPSDQPVILSQATAIEFLGADY